MSKHRVCRVCHERQGIGFMHGQLEEQVVGLVAALEEAEGILNYGNASLAEAAHGAWLVLRDALAKHQEEK